MTSVVPHITAHNSCPSQYKQTTEKKREQERERDRETSRGRGKGADAVPQLRHS